MDCSSLLQNTQSIDYSNTTNNKTTEIWLDLDTTSIFDAEYSWNRTSFWFGLLITITISIISSYILSYHYYPYFDKKQKLIKLKILNIEPHQQDIILPYLEQNTEYNKDVEGIIFDYANIGNESVNSILDSSIELRSPYKDLCLFILISSLLSASYLQFYWVISHWSDSYRSYIETQCYYYHDQDDNDASYFDFKFQVNINTLCPEFEDYIFDTDYDDVKPCYIHKETSKVRASSTEDCPFVCDCCIRCGRPCKGYHVCCQNGCGYCVCIISGLTTLICCIWLIVVKIWIDTEDKYEIEQRAMTVSSNKADKEYLLTVRESSGEID